MSAYQYQMWDIYQKMYGPLNPAIRGDIQAAIIASTYIRAKAKKGKKIKLKDFLPFPIEPRITQTVGQMKNIMQQLAENFRENNG